MHDHKKDFYYFLLFLLGLFILWVATGGPQHAKETGDAYNKFQKPLEPVDSGKTYDASVSSSVGNLFGN